MISLAEYVIRKTVPIGENPALPAFRGKIGMVQGWISIIANIFLFGIKLFFGLISNSIALIADSFHTLSDLAGPTYAHGEQIAKMFLSWLDNDLDKRNIYLSREMPFLGKSKIWKDYNLGRGNINIDEAIKRSIPFYK